MFQRFLEFLDRHERFKRDLARNPRYWAMTLPIVIIFCIVAPLVGEKQARYVNDVEIPQAKLIVELSLNGHQTRVLFERENAACFRRAFDMAHQGMPGTLVVDKTTYDLAGIPNYIIISEKYSLSSKCLDVKGTRLQ